MKRRVEGEGQNKLRGEIRCLRREKRNRRVMGFSRCTDICLFGFFIFANFSHDVHVQD